MHPSTCGCNFDLNTSLIRRVKNSPGRTLQFFTDILRSALYTISLIFSKVIVAQCSIWTNRKKPRNLSELIAILADVNSFNAERRNNFLVEVFDKDIYYLFLQNLNAYTWDLSHCSPHISSLLSAIYRDFLGNREEWVSIAFSTILYSKLAFCQFHVWCKLSNYSLFITFTQCVPRFYANKENTIIIKLTVGEIGKFIQI